MTGPGGAAAEPTLRFPDVESLQDLATYVSRARAVEAEGAIRLQSDGRTLAAWVCALPGRGVFGEGVVLGLRVMPVARDQEPFEATVPLGGLTDRFARRERLNDVGTTVPVPPTHAVAPWAALAPARGGWHQIGTLSAEEVQQRARAGIGEVAQGTPSGAGAHAVAALRERVWSAPLTSVDLAAETVQVPAGVAFAAYSLGFLRPGETGRVFRAAPWTRVSFAAGHVLTR